MGRALARERAARQVSPLPRVAITRVPLQRDCWYKQAFSVESPEGAGLLERLSNSAAETWARAQDAAAQLLAPSVRLGVTGLSRSGKTVFITSLIHNLLAGNAMPFFEPYAQNRVVKAYLEPQPDDAVPRFDYEGNLAKLTGASPEWPEGTRHISELRLTLEFSPSAMMRRAFGAKTMHLDIVDYPGEWVLDLPLLDLSYEEWSRQSIAQAREAFRAPAAKEWLEFLATINAVAKKDEQVARKGTDIFTSYLRKCRDESLSLSCLPPGRFLMPGDLANSPAFTFFPLDTPDTAMVPRNSLWAMMERRYRSYKTHVITPFFRDHFARLDRQIVLADVLTVINAGGDAVADLERALSDILRCFRQGQNAWHSSVTGRRIDRIVFAATKADHLHHTNHDRLEAILQLIAKKSIERASFVGAEVRAFALASVRVTSEAEKRHGNERYPCIVGVPLKGERLGSRVFNGREQLAIFPGDLPEDPAMALSPEWLESGAQPHFVRFRPPRQNELGFGESALLQHIRLDRALNFLIGDKLS
jgi:predicted YcjX-like family ATPase